MRLYECSRRHEYVRTDGHHRRLVKRAAGPRAEVEAVGIEPVSVQQVQHDSAAIDGSVTSGECCGWCRARAGLIHRARWHRQRECHCRCESSWACHCGGPLPFFGLEPNQSRARYPSSWPMVAGSSIPHSSCSSVPSLQLPRLPNWRRASGPTIRETKLTVRFWLLANQGTNLTVRFKSLANQTRPP